jgi:hypothetical protein
LVGNGAGALDAVDPADEFSRIAGYTRGLGERSIGAGFNHPKISVSGTRLAQGIIYEAAINARDHDDDAQQQAQAKVCEHKAQIVLDV